MLFSLDCRHLYTYTCNYSYLSNLWKLKYRIFNSVESIYISALVENSEPNIAIVHGQVGLALPWTLLLISRDAVFFGGRGPSRRFAPAAKSSIQMSPRNIVLMASNSLSPKRVRYGTHAYHNIPCYTNYGRSTALGDPAMAWQTSRCL